MEMERGEIPLVNVRFIVRQVPARADHREGYVGKGYRLEPRYLAVILGGQQDPMAASFKPNQSMWHQQHVRMVDFNFSEA